MDAVQIGSSKSRADCSSLSSYSIKFFTAVDAFDSGKPLILYSLLTNVAFFLHSFNSTLQMSIGVSSVAWLKLWSKQLMEATSNIKSTNVGRKVDSL